MAFTDRYGTPLEVGDRVTASGWRGGHGVIDRFGNRYVYVHLTEAAFPRGDDKVVTFDPEDLRSGWHGRARNADALTGHLQEYTAIMLCFAVDDGLITLEQGRAIAGHLHEYGSRSSCESPTYEAGELSTEPVPVPARD